jgi:hypothetical protein
MNLNAAEKLRDWGARLEQALGILIVEKQTGALLLKTKQGHVFGVTPVPGQAALVFTGVLGIADDTMPPNVLRALLALNVSTGFSGLCAVGIEPSTQEILLKLSWAPPASAWEEQAFAAVLSAFSEHIDALAEAIGNNEILQLLNVSVRTADAPLSRTTLV